MGTYTFFAQELTDDSTLAYVSENQDFELLQDIRAMLNDNEINHAQFSTENGDIAENLMFSYNGRDWFAVESFDYRGNKSREIKRHFWTIQFSLNGGYLPSSTEFFDDYNALRSRIKDIKQDSIAEGFKPVDYRNRGTEGDISISRNEHITIGRYEGIIQDWMTE